MKKFLSLVMVFLFPLLLITSCDKDKNSVEKFSKLSVEENKTFIEDSGIELIQVMNRMRDLQTIDAIASLADISSNEGVKGRTFLSQTRLLSVLKTAADVAHGDKKVNDVYDAMVDVKGEDPESIQDYWNENVGTYTWNPGLEDWDIVLGGNKFIFYFPSSDVSTTNDAIFTISNYSGVTISNPIDDEYTGDLPVSVNADLKVGSETLITFVFGAEYKTDGVPKAIAADLDIEGFKFEVDIAITTELVSASYKFLEGSTVIMKMTASGKGLFTEENYDDNTENFSETNYYYEYIWNPSTQTYEETLVPYTEEWQETDFEEILHSASAEFQLFDVALRGNIDIKSLVDKLNVIDELELEEEDEAGRYTEVINKYLNLRCVKVSSNEIIAKAEAYVFHEIDEYYGWEDYYVSFRLTFDDGSPIDVETYFENGFDDFVDEINSLIYDLNSDYDLDMDLIDY